MCRLVRHHRAATALAATVRLLLPLRHCARCCSVMSAPPRSCRHDALYVRSCAGIPRTATRPRWAGTPRTAARPQRADPPRIAARPQRAGLPRAAAPVLHVRPPFTTRDGPVRDRPDPIRHRPRPVLGRTVYCSLAAAVLPALTVAVCFHRRALVASAVPPSSLHPRPLPSRPRSSRSWQSRSRPPPSVHGRPTGGRLYPVRNRPVRSLHTIVPSLVIPVPSCHSYP